MKRLKKQAVSCLCAMLFPLPALLFAAEKQVENNLNKTVIEFLQPIIEMLSGSQWLQGGAVIFITLTVASLVTWLVFKIIQRITRKTKIDLDDAIAEMVRPPIYYTLLVSGFSYGISLMPISDSIQQICTRSIHTVGVIIWIMFFTRLAALILGQLAGLSHKYHFIQRRTLTLFNNLAKVVIFSIGIYLIFVIWKIDMTAWLASAGVVGIAVGFAAKDTLSNLFSGVFILADAPYKVGDYIVLSNLEGGTRGRVTQIGLRSTRILTRDDVEVTIPNSIIGNSTIVNQSGGPSEKMRVRLTVGVAYGSDIDQVRTVIMDIAKNEEKVCSQPPPSLRFRVFGASSLDFELRCWVDHPEQCSRVIDALNSKIYLEFDNQGIEIPYTKQDLYIKGLPDSFTQPVLDNGSQTNEK